MAKVERDNLPRGAELLKEHVFDPVTGMATSLSGNVEAEQLQRTSSTFRLNLSVPYIGAQFFWSSPGGWFYIPFCLPPLQESFAGTTAGSEYPVPVLTEVGFSFDQRSEPALPADRFAGKAFDATKTGPSNHYVSNIHEGKAVYERAGNVDIKLAIFEKTQHFYNPQTIGSGTGATAVKAPGADSEVFSVTLSAAEISANSSRNNPACYPGLSVPIKPQNTYMFAINADNLVDPVAASNLHTALVSVNVSLKFSMGLMQRDSASAGTAAFLQNVPTASYGARTSETISITTPNAGDVVSADASKGVSAELEKIDSRLRHKIYGGYQDFSTTYVGQQISDDAGYEIIAVPMFNNSAWGETLAQPTFQYWAYDSPPTANADRAVIPITSPMTIHHVLLTQSFMTGTTGQAGGAFNYPKAPLAGKIQFECGVGVVEGGGSDNFHYTQVAHGIVFPDDASSAGLVDFMDMGNLASVMKIAGAVPTYRPQRWEQSIFSVPLVRGSATGTGYTTQGKPFFVGEAATNGYATAPRTNVGNPASAGANIAPPTAGLEQALEVRLKFSTRVAAWNGGGWNGGAVSVDPWDIFSGYGGCWVYIIGKKHMRT
jgi:hypothetical protein